jgi:hypothetical protein
MKNIDVSKPLASLLNERDIARITGMSSLP